MTELKYYTQAEDDGTLSIFSPTEDGNGRRLAKAARALGFGKHVSVVINESGKTIGIRIEKLNDQIGLILYEATKDQSIFGSW